MVTPLYLKFNLRTWSQKPIHTQLHAIPVVVKVWHLFFHLATLICFFLHPADDCLFLPQRTRQGQFDHLTIWIFLSVSLCLCVIWDLVNVSLQFGYKKRLNYTLHLPQETICVKRNNVKLLPMVISSMENCQWIFIKVLICKFK